jgi:hypothetical protein
MKRFFSLLLMLLFPLLAHANEVEIVNVSMRAVQGGWYVSVTLKHDDTGWDHYADEWRLVDGSGKEIAKRVLFHPHEDEQPFTRSLTNVKIPKGIQAFYVEAHDKVHGWSKQRVRVDLGHRQGDRYQIQR